MIFGEEVLPEVMKIAARSSAVEKPGRQEREADGQASRNRPAPSAGSGSSSITVVPVCFAARIASGTLSERVTSAVTLALDKAEMNSVTEQAGLSGTHTQPDMTAASAAGHSGPEGSATATRSPRP